MFKFKDLNLYRLYLHTYMYIYMQINYIHACDCILWIYGYVCFRTICSKYNETHKFLIVLGIVPRLVYILTGTLPSLTQSLKSQYNWLFLFICTDMDSSNQHQNISKTNDQYWNFTVIFLSLVCEQCTSRTNICISFIFYTLL